MKLRMIQLLEFFYAQMICGWSAQSSSYHRKTSFKYD